MKNHKNLRTHSRLYAVLLMLVLAFLLPGCREEEEVNAPAPETPVVKEDPLETRPTIPFTVSGIVVDEDGQPVTGAQVKVHGHQFTTAADGRFVLEKIPVPANRCVIQAAKTGFYPGIRAVTPGRNNRTDTRIVLMGSATTHSFASGSGGNLSLANGSQVKIPANGLVTSTGSLYNGQVNMSLRYLDPSAPGFGFVVSGGDMLARRQDQTTTMLYSYGILRVVMTGAAGEPLQLAPGQTSTLEVDIPDSQLASAPATIPLWYFDEREGIWIEEGEATRQGDKYTGTVKHFTDWNCDVPGGFATIRGRLLDCHGMPAGGYIEFGQITSDPQSSTESRESDGKFEKRVPSGIGLTVVLNDPLLLTPLTGEGRGKLIVVLPPLAEGQVYDMGDIKTFPCQTDLTATIKTAPGDKVRSVLFITRKGSRSVEPVGESLKASLPPGATLTMTIFTGRGAVFTQNITTPAEGEKLDLGVIDLNVAQTPKNVVYLTGKLVCNGTPEPESSVEASWKDNTGNRVNRYTSSKADGSFSLELPPNTSVRIYSATRHTRLDQVIQTPAAPGATTGLGTLELCANPAIGESSFVITGDGFDKKLETLPTNKNYIVFSYARYRKGTTPETTVNVNRLSKDLSFTINFPGQQTGERGSEKTFMRIERKAGNQITYYEAGTYVEGSKLQLSITRYGSVGEPVEGTFSGTFLVKNGAGKTVTITNGIFSVLRHPDL